MAQIDEIDEINDGRVLSRPVRFHFGITSFGVNAYTAHQAGDRLINEHDESQEHHLQEELYLVQRGRATFELDGERVDARAGTLIFVRPAVRRTAFAEEAGTTIVAVGIPGKAYEAQAARSGCRSTISTSQASAEAADQGRELIEAHPEYAGPLYNLACCESLAGRTDDAIRHLRLAIDRKESFRSLAAGTATSTRSATRPLSRSWFRATRQSQLLGNRLAPVASGDIPERWPRRARVSPGRSTRFWAGGEQLPVSLGDDFDVAVDHSYRGLVVDRVRRHR